MELGRVPAKPHPRSPALNSVIEGSGILTRGWRLRPWAPFFFVFFCLPLPSALLLLNRESLGHSLFPERPFCPSHPGLLRYPGILGLWAGATSRRSLFGRGRMELSFHHPPEAAPLGPGEVQDRYPPHPGGHDAAVPRRLSSAVPILPLAPPGFRPGDWDTVTANPGGPVSHEAGRPTSLVEKRKYYHLIVLIRSLYIT
jgi:hypothetical protein